MKAGPVVILGAAGGLGRAYAEHLAGLGHPLWLNDAGVERDGTTGDPGRVFALVDELRSKGASAEGCNTDIAREGGVAGIVAAARQCFGAIGGAIACAAVACPGSSRYVARTDVERALAVELFAGLELIRSCGQSHDAKSPLSIVLNTHAGAARGVHKAIADALIAGSVMALVRSAAVELRRLGIRVNAIAPTARTRMTQDLPLFQGVAAGSLQPAHVAPVVAYLLSSAAETVTGEVIGVAGNRVYRIVDRQHPGIYAEGDAFSEQELDRAWPNLMAV